MREAQNVRRIWRRRLARRLRCRAGPRAQQEWADRAAGTSRPSSPAADSAVHAFEDLFGDVFGGAGRAGPQPGADAETTVEIGLLDAIRGVSTEIAIERTDPCATCAGTGSDRGSETACSDCQGRGRMQVGRGPVAFSRTCPRCGGRGRVAVRACTTCGGRGQTAHRERLSVRVPRGWIPARASGSPVKAALGRLVDRRGISISWCVCGRTRCWSAATTTSTSTCR